MFRSIRRSPRIFGRHPLRKRIPRLPFRSHGGSPSARCGAREPPDRSNPALSVRAVRRLGRLDATTIPLLDPDTFLYTYIRGSGPVGHDVLARDVVTQLRTGQPLSEPTILDQGTDLSRLTRVPRTMALPSSTARSASARRGVKRRQIGPQKKRNGEGGIRTREGMLTPYSLSRRVPSATRPPLPGCPGSVEARAGRSGRAAQARAIGSGGPGPGDRVGRPRPGVSRSRARS
jgi:hypothetical protein